MLRHNTSSIVFMTINADLCPGISFTERGLSACQVLDFVLPECVASQHDLWCCELLGKTIALCDKCLH